jgi:hypothetical protein
MSEVAHASGQHSIETIQYGRPTFVDGFRRSHEVQHDHDQQRKQFVDATRQIRIWDNISHHLLVTTRHTRMEYAQQLANIANVQNYAAGLKNTRLASLKHPGEFFDWQRVCPIL